MATDEWRQTAAGYERAGHRISYQDARGARWRLESVGMVRPWRQPPRTSVTFHNELEDAFRHAAAVDRDDLRSLSAVAHFLLAGVGIVGFLVASAHVIGTISGFVVVVALFYLAVRSIGNGVGELLKDAWGWTRLGPQRRSLLERLVLGAMSNLRRRWLLSSSN